MKNLFLVITHFAIAICFSQNLKINSNKQFTTNQIDSICKINGPYITSEGKITSKVESKYKKDRLVTSGNGGFFYNLFVYHFNEKQYNTLSNIEKRKYDFDQYSELIKASYHEVINYKVAYSEIIDGQFYYVADTLNYAKIKTIRIKNNKEEKSETVNINISELNEIKVIKTVMLFDYKNWIINKNKEILKLYTEK